MTRQSSVLVTLSKEALATHLAALLLTNKLEDVIEALAEYTETYISEGMLGTPPEHIKTAGTQLIKHLHVLKQFAQIIDDDDFFNKGEQTCLTESTR